MSWFSRAPAPPTPKPAAPPSLVATAFPNEEGLPEAIEALCGDELLQRLLAELQPGRWQEARVAMGTLGKDPAAALGAAPVVVAWLIDGWPRATDGYAHYGLNEAGLLCERLIGALRGSPHPAAARLLALMTGPALTRILPLFRPPLHIAHRGLLRYLAAADVRDEPARQALSTLLDAPLPREDQGWHQQTRAEALRLLVDRAPLRPPSPPTPPPAAPAAPEAPPRDLPERLALELRSGSPLRARMALDLALGVDGAAEALAPDIETLLDDPILNRDPNGPSVRAAGLRLLARAARPPPPRPPVASTPAQARLLAVAAAAPSTEAQVAALMAIAAALPRDRHAAPALAEQALSSPAPSVQVAGVALLAALARLELEEPD